jgi:hypothetical protein
MVAMVVLVLQLPYLAHQMWRDPGVGGGGVAGITASLVGVIGGSEPLRLSASAASLAHAVNRIQVDPWQAGWIGWVLAVCGAVIVVRHRHDWSILSVSVLPLLGALVGYAFWVRDYDDYYYLSVMLAAVLTFQFGLTALARGRAANVAAITLFILSIVILPARVSQSATIHRMPEYEGLLDGSRRILRRDVAVREIRAFFLPPGSDSEFLFRVLGGRIESDADWVATVSADGSVSYERVSAERSGI